MSLIILYVISVFVVFQNCAKDTNIDQYKDLTSTEAPLEIVPPEITFYTENQTLTEGQPLNLRVTAIGSQLQYSWLKNSIEMTTNDQYFVAATTMLDAGIYTIKVSNSGGVVSQNITVTINPLLAQTTTCTSSELLPLHASAGTKTLVNGSYGACIPSSCVSGYSLYGNSCTLIFCTTGAYNWTGNDGSPCSAPDQGTMTPGTTLKVTYADALTWSSGSFTWTCPSGGGAAVASAKLCEYWGFSF